MNISDRLKIVKKTFLHSGIFVLTGAYVIVKSIQEDGNIVAEYLDKEGHPHDIEFLPSDLEEI